MGQKHIKKYMEDEKKKEEEKEESMEVLQMDHHINDVDNDNDKQEDTFQENLSPVKKTFHGTSSIHKSEIKIKQLLGGKLDLMAGKGIYNLYKHRFRGNST